MNPDRQRMIDQCREIVARDDHDDPPTSEVIDAALAHLIQSRENILDAREDYSPHVIKDIANTDVLRLYYRTDVESPWRK